MNRITAVKRINILYKTLKRIVYKSLSKRDPELKAYLDKVMTNMPCETCSEAIYVTLNNISENPGCECGVDVKYDFATAKYQPFCSRQCSGSSSNTKEQRRITVRSIYGVDSVSEVTAFRKKAERTMKRRYGVWNANDLPDIAERIKATSRVKYGVDHFTQNEKVKRRNRNTCLEYYGYENAMQHPEVSAKSVKGFKASVGIGSSGQRRMLDKREKTCLNRFGFKHAANNPKIKARQAESMIATIEQDPDKFFKNAYLMKSVVRGKILFRVRGYEDHGIDWMHSKGIAFKDMVNKATQGMPTFRYPKTVGGNNLYVPDFLVQFKGNPWIVEVKSTHTLAGKLEWLKMTRKKLQAVKKEGYRVILLVFSGDGNLLWKCTNPDKVVVSNLPWRPKWL